MQRDAGAAIAPRRARASLCAQHRGALKQASTPPVAARQRVLRPVWPMAAVFKRSLRQRDRRAA
ncbi:hypothetical protein AAW18_15115 [Xanthomonas campestris pv. campestris]|nr:hypothetical protein AAW18_15115 [Xanthomonas campestris pv. campestris]